MENFNYCADLQFDDKNIKYLIDNLNQCFLEKQNNFSKISFLVFSISSYFDKNYTSKEIKSNEYFDKYKLLSKFGFDKTAISRLCNCYKRFIDGSSLNDVKLKLWFNGYSPSKLYELLKLSQLTLEDIINKGLINPSMSVKEIREYIKTISTGKDKAEKVLEQTEESEIKEEDIPMAYNPKQHYDFDYFEEKTKSQLLNIVWDLQKEYERLKKELKK